MTAKSPRRWRDKFQDAFRGIALALREERRCIVHGVVAIAVGIAAVLLRCDVWEWCLLVGCIGAVFTAEVFNASIETLFHALDDATKQRMTGCLDRAAGAVLITAITAAIIGSTIFIRRAIVTFSS